LRLTVGRNRLKEIGCLDVVVARQGLHGAVVLLYKLELDGEDALAVACDVGRQGEQALEMVMVRRLRMKARQEEPEAGITKPAPGTTARRRDRME
jgi:hypothetical protein